MGSNSQTLLDVLRTRSAVDCDTLDAELASRLGPFVDGTSNQAIAYHELVRVDNGGRSIHAQIILDAVAIAEGLKQSFPGVTTEELAVEIMMVKLALRIVPYLKGYSHIQTNPKYAFSKEKTIDNGRRIVALFKELDSSYDWKRVCIKVPATWEGLQACRELERQGIATLATTVFSLEQAALASHVGCTYIAPYINELKVHFEAGYVDQDKAFDLAGSAQRYYEKTSSKTKVLPASLTSVQEVMMLAGANHITVSPPLLKKLAETPANPYEAETGSVFSKAKAGETFGDYKSILDNEAAWTEAFAKSNNGKAKAKLVQAIKIFGEKQEGLEEMARPRVGR